MTLFLDGGLATELEAQGHDISNALWSAGLLDSGPQAIVDAHRAYLDAGAECITTASYQASRQGLMAAGFSATAADRLILRSVELAHRAVDEFMQDNPDARRPLIAASIGPYGAAMQHDGSEYTGIYHTDRTGLAKFHRDRLLLLDGAGADFLAVETIPNFVEAEVLSSLLRTTKTPAWVSFCCRDREHISDGTPLAEAAALFRDHPGVFAVGVNCTSPELIGDLIAIVKASAPGKEIVVYPNSGETFHAEDKSWHGTSSPLECATAAKTWQAAGATLIGGCCRMGPAHIREIRKQLEATP